MPWFEIILSIIFTAAVVANILLLWKTRSREKVRVENERLERERVLLNDNADAIARLCEWNTLHPKVDLADPEKQFVIRDCKRTYHALIAEYPRHANPMWEWTLDYFQSH